jgi:RNA polymerase sigma-70 factor (ECF subfamily)
VWPQTRRASAEGSVADSVIRDNVVDFMRAPAPDRATVDSSPNRRNGCDDAALAKAALVDEAWAQREIWFRFAPMVYGLFRRALGRQYDHEDLTQEVFLRVFRKLHTLEKASAIRSFVYSVAVRLISEEVRRFAWRRRIVEERPIVLAPSTALPANFEMRETLSRIQQTLDGMRDKYRAVFVLRYVEDVDLDEIASGLGISRATVKRYLAKALAFIQRSVFKREGESPIRAGATQRSGLFGGGS